MNAKLNNGVRSPEGTIIFQMSQNSAVNSLFVGSFEGPDIILCCLCLVADRLPSVSSRNVVACFLFGPWPRLEFLDMHGVFKLGGGVVTHTVMGFPWFDCVKIGGGGVTHRINGFPWFSLVFRGFPWFSLAFL